LHIILLQSMSEPLERLMNNGRMKESTERVATLEDVDVETFGLFAEFCYTRNYRAPPKVKAAKAAVNVPNGAHAQTAKRHLPATGVPTAYCYKCGVLCPSTMPNGTMHCSRCSPWTFYCVLCHGFAQNPKLCQPCSNKPEFRRLDSLTSRAALSQRLEAKRYGAMGMNHDELRAHLKGMKPEDEPSDKLVYHAKLYVFATMYMIQSLKDLSLHKLARDLDVFDFQTDSAGEFAELFHYVYVNTSGNDDDTIGTGSELRDLVVTHAACQAEFLVENKPFLEVLEEGGEGASAFAIFLAKRL
jgi:hypothetical protein